ncbi:hypothetical protein HRI_005279700 [Hibiscus trionum]|uniref:VQ domain-containing protein n=1 Tax=Hibiscus trionum TaxID=183268 RepID=A0A9W7MX43_HIBTR|nr:hypothetical protein HRI_005279700 [Hibiscus trionum]
MGKKVIHQLASTRTSKNVDVQLHSVNKVLRPKVYITHSSSFKQLVQELTGYRDQTVPVPDDVAQVVPAIGTEDQEEMFPDLTSTLFTNSSSFELLDEQAFQWNDMNQIAELLQTDDRGMFDEMSDLSTSDGQTDWLACRNLESWLFDADPYCGGRNEQEVSMFDYELLSGLI